MRQIPAGVLSVGYASGCTRVYTLVYTASALYVRSVSYGIPANVAGGLMLVALWIGGDVL